jgi:hypothetical protein
VAPSFVILTTTVISVPATTKQAQSTQVRRHWGWSESAKQEPQELRDRHSKRESDQSIPDPALLTWVDRERRFGVARLTSAIT